ncbi:MAG: PEP-CTERM sorting domain-containing protein [Sulfuricaulis sp.]|uniref:PEP-CTERM sorting domain-containing protein n=1 Tax=Sulfuricaulis sp. TaxID=2003553 RepID=UPI0025FCDD72|nr:PEP-CTERM sorting domain-containing protein [Sulfuricaulis sp.]MCR4346465.1 PEP-CTERM sorting domain-containing protein [Sulfuricaulis sp.]
MLGESSMKFHHRWAATALFVIASGVSALTHAASVSGQGTWETTLQGRDLDGNLSTFEAYYDTVLDITWLANAGYAGTSRNWLTANAWAMGLNPYGSNITGWRLPTTIDVGNDGATIGVDAGYNMTTHSEMSHMFYVTLGNKAVCTTSGTCFPDGWGLTNTGPFYALVPDSYWSATEFAPSTNAAWMFNYYNGNQGAIVKTNGYQAWAVHAGDVGAASTVPVPAAMWLFGSGLLGLIGFARRKTT